VEISSRSWRRLYWGESIRAQILNFCLAPRNRSFGSKPKWPLPFFPRIPSWRKEMRYLSRAGFLTFGKVGKAARHG
jgi:hypothetical protein